MRASKFGSDLRERFEINFFRQVGHSLLLERGRKKEGGSKREGRREGGRGREEEGGRKREGGRGRVGVKHFTATNNAASPAELVAPNSRHLTACLSGECSEGTLRWPLL